jgi:hypothetical protein
MKTILLALTATIFLTSSFAQIHNVKKGNWSDISVWNSNQVPSPYDDVVLNFDVFNDNDAFAHRNTQEYITYKL